jgi:Arc/MetJ family transcription regulator
VKPVKRVRLTLDENLLDEVLQHSGERTPSAAVTRALEEFIKASKARQILQLAGSGVWEGDLNEMRGRSTASLRRERPLVDTGEPSAAPPAQPASLYSRPATQPPASIATSAPAVEARASDSG